MFRPTMYQHAQSLIAPIRAVSIGGLAHEALCGDRLRARACVALDLARQPQATTFDRYSGIVHASGLTGAAGLRIVTRAVSLPLDLLVGTGRHRYTGSDAPQDRRCVNYVEALINHPLDTGLLGLISAYNLAKHAMIAGCAGAALGAVLGLVLWPWRGWPEAEPLAEFVELWVKRGAFYAGSFGALMGSCLIMAPHNYIAMQGLRVLTAVPKLLANLVGYGVGATAGAMCLVLYDGALALAAGVQHCLWGASAGQHDAFVAG